MNKEIVNFNFDQSSNVIEVTYRIKSNRMLMSSPPQKAPDEIYKIVYGVKNGKIVEEKRIQGRHIREYVKERFEFDE